MVPFVSLIAAMWGFLVFGIQCYRAVKRRWSPRIRFQNGEHCTPRGGALFANDAVCPICLETLRGCEVRAEQMGALSANPFQVKVLPCRHVLHVECCARMVAMAADARARVTCPTSRGRLHVAALREFLFE